MTTPTSPGLPLPASGGLPRASLAALVAANCIPLAGVMFLGWTIGGIMLLFWLENALVGAFNVLRMWYAAKEEPKDSVKKVMVIPFFMAHYGLFTMVHGMFVFTLFISRSPTGLGFGGFLLALLALVASHGISFATNYIGRDEYRHVTAMDLMERPYSRVLVLHIVIIFGGIAVMATGQPMAALVILVLLKIGIDIAGHLKERDRLAQQLADDESAPAADSNP